MSDRIASEQAGRPRLCRLAALRGLQETTQLPVERQNASAGLRARGDKHAVDEVEARLAVRTDGRTHLTRRMTLASTRTSMLADQRPPHCLLLDLLPAGSGIPGKASSGPRPRDGERQSPNLHTARGEHPDGFRQRGPEPSEERLRLPFEIRIDTYLQNCRRHHSPRLTYDKCHTIVWRFVRSRQRASAFSRYGTQRSMRVTGSLVL